jgi:hypothetical protein
MCRETNILDNVTKEQDINYKMQYTTTSNQRGNIRTPEKGLVR